jgi:hypothetical protein
MTNLLTADLQHWPFSFVKEIIVMDEMRIKLSALWIALMLTYLLGDVLRIFGGDFQAGEIGGQEIGQGLCLALAALMAIPIVMVFLSLILTQGVNRWANIILAIFFSSLISLDCQPTLRPMIDS